MCACACMCVSTSVHPCVCSCMCVHVLVSSDSLCLLITEYDLVTAYEVDQNGDYVSHTVVHHERKKRSAAEGGLDSLQLHFHGFGHDFQLDLKTSDFLVAPGFTIQTLGKGRTKSIHTYPAEDFCFYQGVLRMHKSSSVALSTCGGLVSKDIISVPSKTDLFAFRVTTGFCIM